MCSDRIGISTDWMMRILNKGRKEGAPDGQLPVGKGHPLSSVRDLQKFNRQISVLLLEGSNSG